MIHPDFSGTAFYGFVMTLDVILPYVALACANFSDFVLILLDYAAVDLEVILSDAALALGETRYEKVFADFGGTAKLCMS